MMISLEAMARAGGGGGGGHGGGYRKGGGGGYVVFLSSILIIIRIFWVRNRLRKRSKDISLALQKLSQVDPLWTEGALLEKAEAIFRETQAAWSEHDLKKLGTLIHPALLPKWKELIRLQKIQNERNEATDIKIKEIFIIDVENYQDNSKDNFTVYFCVDCTEKYRTRTSARIEFEEYWTFEWEEVSWKVSKVDQLNALKRTINKKIINESRATRLTRSS